MNERYTSTEPLDLNRRMMVQSSAKRTRLVTICHSRAISCLILIAVTQNHRRLDPSTPADSKLEVIPHNPTQAPAWMRRYDILLDWIHDRGSLIVSALAVFVVSATTALGVRPISDPSPWLHLRIGQYLLAGGRFGSPDPWAPFATRQYVPTEWLPAIVGYLTYDHFGAPGIAWLRSAGILALLTALVWTTRRAAGAIAAIVASFVALLGAHDGLTERPQLISLVFLVVTLGAWWRTTEDLRPRWWLVPVTWVWACSHGLWLVGIGVGALIACGLASDNRIGRRQLRKLLLVPLASLGAVALTPIGPKLLLAPFTVGSNARDFVGEWQPSTIHQPVTVIALLMIGFVLIAWARSARRPHWWQVGLLVTSLVFAFAMARTVAVAAVLVAPLLAQELQNLFTIRVPRPSRRAQLSWVGLIVAALVISAPLAGAVAQNPQGVPAHLAAQLRQIPSGTRVVATGDVTGWLLWSAPDLKPVEDIRIEVYSPSYVRRYIEAMAAGPAWRGFIQDTGATVALLESESPLATALRERAGWRSVGSDDGYVMLRRP